jgi:spore coat protein U-like protein
MSNTMKKLAILAALGLAVCVPVTEAANTTGTFDVTINLTSSCSIGAIANVVFDYTSFQVGNQPSTGGGFNLTCTNTLPYTFGLVAGAGGAAPGAASINVTDAAVNLSYTLNAPAGANGNGAAQAITISGTMAGAQGGTCAAATCSNAGSGNKTQTLVVNF